MPKTIIKPVVEDLAKLNDAELIDLLVAHTDKYTEYVISWEMNTLEYKECKEMVRRLQQEIESRHKTGIKKI